MAVKAPAPRRKAVAKPAARPAGAAASATPAAAAAAPTPIKPRTSPGQFINEVRAETRKISWPSWKETWITSAMVGVMVTVTALFFFVVDGALAVLLQQFLRLAS